MDLFKNWVCLIKQHVFIKFIYDKNYSNDTNIIQNFISHGLGLCIKVDSYVAHILYEWSFSHTTAVLIDIYKNKHFPSLNTDTTVFS